MLMRKLLLIVLLGNMLFANAQDKVVLRDGTELNVKVIESNDNNIVFTYPNEDVRNEKPKSLINSFSMPLDVKRNVIR